jgi:3-methyl-2-oxobutanoate hydroxymethyltransferase
MKNIYTFGRKMAKRNYTVRDLQDLKQSNEPALTNCNPGNFSEIQACVEAGIDTLTIRDDQIEMAREIAPHHFVISGINRWGEFITKDDFLRHAIDCMERGADAYYCSRSYEVIETLAREGIPVQAHLGLVPSLSHWVGGLRALGRTADEAMKIFEDFRRCEDAGAFACEIECVAEETLRALNKLTSIVTVSLGSGKAGDIVSLFMADICGEADIKPKHAHAFGNLMPTHKKLFDERLKALHNFQNAVRTGAFPFKEQTINMREGEEEKLSEALAKIGR